MNASGKLGAMTKPGDPHDATQPLSESQVVAVTPNPPPIATNDQSIAWKGTVVSADEFAPAAKRPSRARWLVVGALGAAAIGGAAFALWPHAAPTAVAPALPPPSSLGSGSASAPALVPPPIDAAPPVDAAPIGADAAVDQAVPPPKPVTPTKKKKPRPHH